MSVAQPAVAHGTVTAPGPTYEKDPYGWDAAQGDDDKNNNDDSDEFARKEDL